MPIINGVLPDWTTGNFGIVSKEVLTTRKLRVARRNDHREDAPLFNPNTEWFSTIESMVSTIEHYEHQILRTSNIFLIIPNRVNSPHRTEYLLGRPGLLDPANENALRLSN